MKQTSYNNNRPRRNGGRYRSPYKTFFWLALVLTLIVVAALLYIKFPVYLAYLIGLNAVTFSFYGYDKLQAKRQAGRVPELVLHWLAVLGGPIGGLAGQWLFHHKTSKPIFHIVLWASLVVHLAVFFFFSHFLLTTNLTDLFGLLKPR